MLTPTLQSIQHHLQELGYKATERYPTKEHIHDTIHITNPNPPEPNPDNSINLILSRHDNTLHIDRYHQGEDWHDTKYGPTQIDLNHPNSIPQLEATLATWLK